MSTTHGSSRLHARLSRFHARSSVAALAIAIVSAACDPPAAIDIALPEGLPIAELSPAQRALLRATLEVSDGALAETEVRLDVDALTISGDFALQNVTAAGERALTLRVYGRSADPGSAGDLDAEGAEKGGAEVLLGAIETTLAVSPSSETRISFAGETFETCDAGIDGRCALLFDENRNLTSNVLDLVAGIDPAPQAPFVDVAPSTLQFPSGIRLGDFARQVIVLENRGPHPIRVVRAEVVGGQGVALSLFDPTGLEQKAPRRALDLSELDPAVTTIAPTNEILVAVSFAPVNLFLTTGAVQVVVEDTVTGVAQTARVKVIANAQGTLRAPPPDYASPEVGAVAVDVGSLSVAPFPSAQLFSGLAVTGGSLPAADASDGRLAHTGALVLVEDAAGAPLAMPADLAFAVDIPARHRFSTSLGGLESDVDLGVFTLDDGALVPACATCLSSNAGDSPESAELRNESDAPLRVLVVLGRVDLAPAIVGVEGALVAGPALVDYELSAHVTKGPELDDVDPVAPADGPLEGGVVVTLKGRGFDPRAVVTFADALALDVIITNDADGRSTISLTLPPGSLEVGKNPATVVVVNPSLEDGGDGQAATLPEGFTFQPPAPRITGVAPSIAPTTGSALPIAIDGAFFSTRFGPPVVRFGAVDADGADGGGTDDVAGIAVDATFVSATLVLVTPPALPLAEQAAGKTVSLTVANRLAPDRDAPDVERFGAPSNARDFRFVVPVGDAPTIASIAPATGPIDGGDTITIAGSGFRAGAAVLIGGAAADTGVAAADGTSILATTPARADDGAVDVVIVNEDGQSATLAAAFTYSIPAPTITSVFPDRATVSGGTVVVVTGAGFRDGARATFVRSGADGDEAVPALNVTRVSTTTLLVLTPATSAGTVTLVIENVDGQRASAPGFALFAPEGPPPSVIGIEPASGPAAGGFLVTLVGNGFVSPSVLFGSTILSGDAIDVVDAAGAGFDRITFTAPPSANGGGGAVAVQVVNGDQQSDGTTFTYGVAAPASPRVDRVEPAHVSGTATTLLHVFGANLADVVDVLAGGSSIPFTVRSSFEVQASLPPSAPGPLLITVVTAGGDVGSFPITVAGAPTFAGLSSSIVHAGVAGDQIAIFGEGLDAEDLAIDVRDGAGTVAANVLVATSGFMLVELPRLDAGNALRLVARAAGGVSGSGLIDDVESPPFSARAPLVTFTTVSEIDPDGTLTFTALGEHLNPTRLSSVVLVDLTGSGRNVPCVVLSAGEGSVVCRSTIGAFPARNYGVALSFTEVFAGTSAAVDVVLTSDGLPQLVFVPDVGQLALCGDEFVRPDEECDDGNLDDTDACTSACTEAACGDSFVQAGESCDDGNGIDDDACDNRCTLASCGDGVVQAGEQCDDGDADDTDSCTSACTLPTCGDAFVQVGEQCDDGNAIEEDGCNARCERGVCGDAIVQVGEGCDDGNNDDGDDCSNDCALSSCGDGSLQLGEECDDGNLADTDTCTSACRLAACGDGTQQSGEVCDDGNLDDTDACTAICRPAACGDGILHAGETCDDGNVADTDACTSSCVPARCGDALVQLLEECDDGNLDDTDRCTTGCRSDRCGDTFVQAGESCDDGNVTDDDGCTNACALPTCGDAIAQVGEECDDGNAVDADACTNACTQPVCGDGITHAGEECDDGNASNTDDCTNNCTDAVCGDTFVQAGEACDDGNASDTDACTSACEQASCGDGFVQGAEQCDDADLFDDDECTNACTLPRCGDAIVQSGEGCDDGDVIDVDECTNACELPAALVIAPPSNGFPGIVIGDTSAPITFIVTNTGGATSGPLAATFVGPDALHFGIGGDACIGATLVAGGSCAIDIVFAPTSRGPKAANLVISGTPGGAAFASLTGTGLSPGSLSANPISRDFGAIVLDAASAPFAFAITNDGDVASGALGASLSGAAANEFAIDGNGCTGPLAAGATCIVNVRFTPTSPGTRTATLAVSGVPGGLVSAALSGTGITGASLQVDPPLQAYGDVLVDGSTAPSTFTVVNSGQSPTGLLSVALTGSDANHFAFTGNTCATLSAGASCLVSVRFAPSTVGSKAATLSISASPGGTVLAALSGTSLAPASLAVDQPSLDFATAAIGAPGAVRVVVVTNTGGSASGGVATNSTNTEFQIVGGDCGAPLPSGASCTTFIQFFPSSTGPRSATFTASASPGGVAATSLFGTGEPPPPSATSCSAVLAQSPGAQSGIYPIDVDGPGPLPPLNLECDMAFDGGGWTLIMATGFLGPDLLSIGEPRSNASSTRLDTSAFLALADKSEQVHIRAAGDLSRSATSRPGTTPIQDMRQGTLIYGDFDQRPTDFTGPMVPQLQMFCPNGAPTYPSIFQACGNGDGLHLVGGDSRWQFNAGQENMEVWLRDAPIAASCAALFLADPLAVPGEYFIDADGFGGIPGGYEFCGAPPPPGSLLVNGTFTGGLSGWATANNSGEPAPWLGDGAVAFVEQSLGPGARVLFQNFVVPATVPSASFSFEVAFNPPGALTPDLVQSIQQPSGDALRIDVIDAGGDVFTNPILVELFAPFNGVGSVPDVLVPISVDASALLAFAQANPGRNVALRIGHVESGFPFPVFLDNVVLSFGSESCGDGVIDPGEQCDDLNVSDGDGCSSACQREPGFLCIGVPSSCVPATCASSSLTSPPTGAFEATDEGVTTSGAGLTSINRSTVRTTSDLFFPIEAQVDVMWNSPGIAFFGTRSSGLRVAAGSNEPSDSVWARVHNNVGGNNTMAIFEPPFSSVGAAENPPFGPLFGHPYRFRIVDDGINVTFEWIDLIDLTKGTLVRATPSPGGGARLVLSGDDVVFSNLAVCSGL